MTSVTYPPSAAPALGFLKSNRNDIAIYVEDTAAPNIWVKLLKNFLPEGVKLNDVNCLGGRDKVIAACKLDQSLDGRKKLYIIDADLDLIMGISKPNLKHLYRLRSYCLENYLLNNKALLNLATTCDLHVGELEAQRKIGLEKWVDDNSEALKKLFICYAIMHSLPTSQPTVSYHVTRLRKNSPKEDYICRKKVGKRIINLYKDVRNNLSAKELRKKHDYFLSSANKHSINQIVSGKDYIFPLMYNRLKKHFKTNFSHDHCKAILAQATPPSVDIYLKNRIHKICKA